MNKSSNGEGCGMGWCETCHAHIVPMKRWERWLSSAAWHVVMHWPHRWFANKLHLAILPWAGNRAYRCWCTHPINQEGE